MTQQKSPDSGRLFIDGKPVRKYLFGRKSFLDGRTVLCAVEAFDKDHALARLSEAWPFILKMEWDFLDELDPEHFMGAMGTDLPLIGRTRGTRLH
jgi:hypothetical protein